MSERTPAAGWHDDPEAPGYVRWWDGNQWADMQMPKSLAPGPPSKTDQVADLLGGVGKLILFSVLLVVMLVLLYVAVSAFF